MSSTQRDFTAKEGSKAKKFEPHDGHSNDMVKNYIILINFHYIYIFLYLLLYSFKKSFLDGIIDVI
jgi:hypothetical protein